MGSYAFDFRDLSAILDSRRIQNSIELAQALPPSYRQRRVLGYRTRQHIQYASWLEPRAITYGEDGKVLMAWANPARGRKDVVEVQVMDDDGGTPLFGKIAYDNSLRRMIFRPDTTCVGCHSTRLHPNWSSYPHWAGFYGSLHHSWDKPEFRFERENFKRFLEQSANTGIYAALGGELTLAELSEANADLTDFVNRWNGKRLTRDLLDAVKAHPQFAAAIDVALTDIMPWDQLRQSNRILDFLPAMVANKPTQLLLDEKFEDTRRAVHGMALSRYSQEAELLGRRPRNADRTANFDMASLNQVAGLRLIFEEFLKLPTQDWAATREAGSYTFTGAKEFFFDKVSKDYRRGLSRDRSFKSVGIQLESLTYGTWNRAGDEILGAMFKIGKRKSSCDAHYTN